MGRPVTLCTGQWADLKLADLAKKAKAWGYDGLELACWGDHFDPLKGAEDKKYCDEKKAMLADSGLKVWAISNHLAGQLVLDPNDFRTDDWVPKDCKGKPEKKREYGIRSMKACAHAAKNLGIKVVCGFTGSPIWQYVYSFPPVPQKTIDDAFLMFAEKWNPILDEFKKCGAVFGHETHPTELAFDLYTAQKCVEAIGGRKEFGFNFDPSHLHWQFVDPVQFIYAFPDRIYHTHMKDAAVQLDGKSGILASHLNFGDRRRGWDFRSLGRGGVKFEEIVRALNHIKYEGPLSVEWEDSGMEREHGAAEACAYVRKLDFKSSGRAFDSSFER